jgi:hypothetical protein
MIISFGHNDGEWKSKYSFTPKSIINSATSLFSKTDDVDIHEHNKGEINTFYDSQSPSLLGVAFNDNPSSNKIFKTISIEGSEPIVQKLHNFAPKKSTDSPSSNNFVSTTEGEVKGGIIYHGLERSSELRNGATVHYVGDISNVSPDVALEGGLQVTVDNASSDYIPAYDAVYGIYLPDTNQFYFGEGVESDSDITICDILNLLFLTDSYNVSTGLDVDGAVNSITVSIPVIPNTDPSTIDVTASSGSQVIEGVLDTVSDVAFSWTITLPEALASRLGTWVVEITATDSSDQTCEATELDSIEVTIPKPVDDEGDGGNGGDDGGGSDDGGEEDPDPDEDPCRFVDDANSYTANLSNGANQSDGSITISFDASIGIPNYQVFLIVNQGTIDGQQPGQIAENANGDGCFALVSQSTGEISVTFDNLLDGFYNFAVVDATPNGAENSEQTIEGYEGCTYVSQKYQFLTELPEEEFSCTEFSNSVVNNVVSIDASALGNQDATFGQFIVTLGFPESEFSQYDTFFDGDFSGYLSSLGQDADLSVNIGFASVTVNQADINDDLIAYQLTSSGEVPALAISFSIQQGQFPAGTHTVEVSMNGCNPVQIGTFEIEEVIDPEPEFTPVFGEEAGFPDFNYDGAVTTADLLQFLIEFSTVITDEDNANPVYGTWPVQATSGNPLPDLNNDATVSTADLLEFLVAFGQLSTVHLQPGAQFGSSLKWPDLGEELQNYAKQLDLVELQALGLNQGDAPDGVISPAYFFDEDGDLIPGAPDPRDYGPVAGSNEFFDQQAERGSKSALTPLVNFVDLNNLDGVTPALTPPEEGSFPAVDALDPSQYFIQTLSSDAFDYMLESLPANAQLYAFKNTEVYGDDLRGQTSEMLMDLGSEDFELFAVNLNYELVNADHTR